MYIHINSDLTPKRHPHFTRKNIKQLGTTDWINSTISCASRTRSCSAASSARWRCSASRICMSHSRRTWALTKETEKNWRLMIVSQEKRFQSSWNWETIQYVISDHIIKKWYIFPNDQPWITVSSLLEDSTELTFTSPDDACWTRSAWCASSTACAARSCKAPKSSTSNKLHCHFRSWFDSLANQPTCGLYQLYLINSN